MHTITCTICGLSVKVRYPAYRTCGGEQCKTEHARRQKRLSNMKHGKARLARSGAMGGMEFEHRECPQCKKPFEVWEKSSKVYCSESCRRAAASDLDRKRKAGAPRSVVTRVRKLPHDTLWPTISPAIACQDYDYPVHVNHAAFCPFPGVTA